MAEGRYEHFIAKLLFNLYQTKNCTCMFGKSLFRTSKTQQKELDLLFLFLRSIVQFVAFRKSFW